MPEQEVARAPQRFCARCTDNRPRLRDIEHAEADSHRTVVQQRAARTTTELLCRDQQMDAECATARREVVDHLIERGGRGGGGTELIHHDDKPRRPLSLREAREIAGAGFGKELLASQQLGVQRPGDTVQSDRAQVAHRANTMRQRTDRRQPCATFEVHDRDVQFVRRHAQCQSKKPARHQLALPGSGRPDDECVRPDRMKIDQRGPAAGQHSDGRAQHRVRCRVHRSAPQLTTAADAARPWPGRPRRRAAEGAKQQRDIVSPLLAPPTVVDTPAAGPPRDDGNAVAQLRARTQLELDIRRRWPVVRADRERTRCRRTVAGLPLRGAIPACTRPNRCCRRFRCPERGTRLGTRSDRPVPVKPQAHHHRDARRRGFIRSTQQNGAMRRTLGLPWRRGGHTEWCPCIIHCCISPARVCRRNDERDAAWPRCGLAVAGTLGQQRSGIDSECARVDGLKRARNNRARERECRRARRMHSDHAAERNADLRYGVLRGAPVRRTEHADGDVWRLRLGARHERNLDRRCRRLGGTSPLQRDGPICASCVEG